MFSSLSESLFGNSPDKKNVNMSPRSGRKPTNGRSKVAADGSEPPTKEEIIASLQRELQIKTAAADALSSKVERLEDSQNAAHAQAANIQRRYHPVITESNIIGDKGRQRVKMGTRGSITTMNILQSAGEPEKTDVQCLAERFLKVFQDPTNYITYLQSEQFGLDLLQVCGEVSTLLEQQPRCLFLQSPVYVFGDIHGNLEDLHFFADNIWKMGMDLTAGKFLFLGDYVDRGMNCLECVAYLFGLKILYPHKIDLLRGNHETRDVNGWEDHYGEKSFLFQCKQRFGEAFGEQIWEECNSTFDRLPLAAVIDHEIFCIHGGLPRPIDNDGMTHTYTFILTYTYIYLHILTYIHIHIGMTEIESILAMPNIVSIMPPYEHEEEWMKQVATDCIW
jgi:hypothetical protein